MNLYLIERGDFVKPGELESLVVVADDAESALDIAVKSSGDERSKVWLMPSTKIVLLGVSSATEYENTYVCRAYEADLA